MESLFPALSAGVDLHPASVHLPLAAWVLGFLVLLFEVRKPGEALRTAGRWLVHAGTLGAVVASGLGLLAASQMGHEGPEHDAVHDHRNMMLAATAISALVSGLLEHHRRRDARWSARTSVVGLGLVCVLAVSGGDHGVHMVYEMRIGVTPAPVEEVPEIVEPAPPIPALPWRTSSDYEQGLEVIDSVIASNTARADSTPSSWLAMQRVSSAHLDRAKLTGDIDGYVRALELLDQAFERAPEGGGPHIARATLAFSVHRLPAAEEAVNAAASGVIARFAPIAEIEGLRGDIALHRCLFDEARTHYEESDRIDASMTSAFRLALLEWRLGRFDEADALILAALRRLGGLPSRGHAFLHLQRGLLDLDRGRYSEALSHYNDADAAFGGWWLIHEHIAETLAALGLTELATVAYRDVVERTHNPELMDALAEMLALQGDTEEAERLTAEAAAAFAVQLEQLPESAYGHALDHYLGTRDPRALELARANFELRPNGQAHLALAEALVMTGEVEEAADVVRGGLATGYRSAGIHAAAAVLYEATGDAEGAAAQRALALEIAPDAMDDTLEIEGQSP